MKTYNVEISFVTNKLYKYLPQVPKPRNATETNSVNKSPFVKLEKHGKGKSSRTLIL